MEENTDVFDPHLKLGSEEINIDGENYLEIEEGPLDDSEITNFSSSGTTRFYNLQVEETVDQMSLASAETDRLNEYGERRIVFSPGGDQGYLYTHTRCDIMEEDEGVNKNKQTPRDIDDNLFLGGQRELHNTVGTRMSAHAESAYNSYDSSVVTWSPRSGGQLTDRTSSPSVASVTSNLSMTGRRYLEWDYGSDLGPQYQTQGEAAQSLSQLEKLAIGSYTEYLKKEPLPDKKEKIKRAADLLGGKPDYLPESEGEDMMRANRFSNFADSLMRQRQVQQQERVRKRSVSRDRLRARQETADIARQAKEDDYQDVGTENIQSKSPMKSASMTDIPKMYTVTPSRSSSTHSLALVSHNIHMSGPSSSSSAGTVVAVQNRGLLPGMFGDLSIISTSPRSLPPHLQDMMVTRSEQECDKTIEEVSVRHEVFSAPLLQNQQECDGEMFKHCIQDKEIKHECLEGFENHSHGNEVGESSVSILEGVISVSDKSDQNIPPDRPLAAWSQDASVSNFQIFPTDSKSDSVKNLELKSPARSRRATQSSEPSSVPSTSDEELDGGKQAILRLLPMRDYQGDTSTMESVRIIDRAKSFEYIPGSSFPLQENSSSYEYLPGHLVADNRPPTVLTRRTESVHTQQSSSNPSIDKLSLSSKSLILPSIHTDLESISAELKGKSKELLNKNISQTKHFFKKLDGYIEFLSTPSLTLEDSRVKQELAGRIMVLLSTEESRLGAGLSCSLSSIALSSSSDVSRIASNTSGDSEVKCVSYRKQGQVTSSSRSKNSKPSTSTSQPTRTDLSTRSNKTNTGQYLSSESSTRQMVQSVASSVSAENLGTSDQTSKSSNNSSRLFDWKQERTQSEKEYQKKQKKRERRNQIMTTENVEFIQKKRVEHLKKLKKEIKELEKLDSIIARATGGKHTPLSQISLPSAESSKRREPIKRSSPSKEPKQDTIISKELPITIPSLLSTNHKGLQARKINENKQSEASSVHSEDVQAVLKQGKRSSRSTSLSSTGNSEIVLKSFGQMFPTPIQSDAETSITMVRSLTTKTIATMTTSHDSVEIQTERTVTSEDSLYASSMKIKPDRNSPRKKRRSLPDAVAKKKPVAYHLPLDSLSPIRIGRRVLREITGDTENVFYSFKNRNIISGYVASLDQQPIERKASQPAPTYKKSDNPFKLSLQEALFRRRKDFLKSCEERMSALSQAKDARLLRSAKQTTWLEEVACQSPRSRRMAEPSFTPVPVLRVFNHRDMVRATREKYNELPEMQNLKLDNKKTNKYRNNRLMADIYSSRLQRNVVIGKVSLTHHQMIV